MLPYKIQLPAGEAIPILISVPHCGTGFPDDLKTEYDQKLIAQPDDTDWFVDKLYDFAPAMGITMISATYSRWVIDLNRDPESKPLYTDGRIITGLCPTTNFLGEPLYNDKRNEIQKSEVDRRLSTYYWPYHEKIQTLLDDLKTRFGKVLLWDCHSIRQRVPTIQPEKFPDLILGSADKTSAAPQLIDMALRCLGSGDYSLSHNSPFKGGYITRNFGKPTANQHALQLEMCKVHYMDDAELNYNGARADKMRNLLKTVFTHLAEQLKSA
ncbi:MAG TPA: N-formylglutamate amidohydrolase [Chryseosolibacter sp.]